MDDEIDALEVEIDRDAVHISLCVGRSLATYA